MNKPAPLRLTADVLLPLTARSNAPGVRRALGHIAAIALCTAALWTQRGSLWSVPLSLLLGYLLAFMFNALHECAHQTPFRTRALNYLLGHLGSGCAATGQPAEV